jgi:cyclopropane-fatty-acyl-phospholipid synthase
MEQNKWRGIFEKLLTLADVKINGSRPWDIQVRNEKFYRRVITEKSMGMGESYMDGWWDAEKLDELFTHLFRAEIDKVKIDWRTILFVASQVIFNPQRKSKSFEVGRQHYDLGNDLYRAMLDPRMVYSCGYWKNAANLAEAQEAKMDLICRKIRLKPGQKVLDIGCGWGSFAKFAAEKYGAIVTGVTVSKEQAELARQSCVGLPVEIILQDYRDITEMFDYIVSIGMFEHVGYKNYRTFMKIAGEHLKDDGLFLLHTIGQNDTIKTTDAWLTKYIFTNSSLPSIKQIGESIENIFRLEDWHSFGTDYDKTIMVWLENFEKNWETLKPKYNDRFYRMWKFYLSASAATFRCRNNQLWQIVLSKKGLLGGCEEVR